MLAAAMSHWRLRYDPDLVEPWFVRNKVASMLVPDPLRKAVAFIGVKDKGVFRPCGTAFFVSIEEEGMRFTHIVTAEHVVASIQRTGREVWLRVNTKDGGSDEICVPIDMWRNHPENHEHATDVMSAIINFDNRDDIMTIPVIGPNAAVATPEVIVSESIGIGDEVVIVGLFYNHYGLGKNIPIIRIGNLALLEEEKIKTKYCGYTDAHLIEARSIGGLSGSPVFIHMPPVRVIAGKPQLVSGPQFYLLGLVHGHFDIQNMNEDSVIDDDVSPFGRINTGIGVVIPAQKIIETLNREGWREGRRNAIKDHIAANGATPDGAA